MLRLLALVLVLSILAPSAVFAQDDDVDSVDESAPQITLPATCQAVSIDTPSLNSRSLTFVAQGLQPGSRAMATVSGGSLMDLLIGSFPVDDSCQVTIRPDLSTYPTGAYALTIKGTRMDGSPVEASKAFGYIGADAAPRPPAAATPPPPLPIAGAVSSGPALEVRRGSTCETSARNGFIHASGEVRNISERNLPLIEAEVTWRNSRGEFVMSESSFIDPLTPGQSGRVSVVGIVRGSPSISECTITFRTAFDRESLSWVNQP